MMLGERVGMSRMEFESAGRLHTDALTWTMLRRIADDHPEPLRVLLTHELAHFHHPGDTEAQVIAPLPTTWPAELRTAVARASRQPVRTGETPSTADARSIGPMPSVPSLLRYAAGAGRSSAARAT